MRSDVNYSHSKNIGEAVGSFCELPIRSYDNFALELDVALDVQSTVLRNRAMGCSDIPNTAEIMPGELLCADNIIRRVTTAEATGYDTFKEKNPVKMLVGASDGRMYDAEENQWYIKEKKLRQSTPEELSAWLNDMPKRSFKSRVEVDGKDKLLITDAANGEQLYAFRYVEGLPATYIGGDETRPFDPPQFVVGTRSPSHVVQYFDKDEAIRLKRLKEESEKEAALEDTRAYAKFNFETWQELDNLRRDCDARYIPTSHVERITVGGTALFAPEETA